jgi:hypothetical protein
MTDTYESALQNLFENRDVALYFTCRGMCGLRLPFETNVKTGSKYLIQSYGVNIRNYKKKFSADVRDLVSLATTCKSVRAALWHAKEPWASLWHDYKCRLPANTYTSMPLEDFNLFAKTMYHPGRRGLHSREGNVSQSLHEISFVPTSQGSHTVELSEGIGFFVLNSPRTVCVRNYVEYNRFRQHKKDQKLDRIMQSKKRRVSARARARARSTEYRSIRFKNEIDRAARGSYVIPQPLGEEELRVLNHFNWGITDGTMFFSNKSPYANLKK